MKETSANDEKALDQFINSFNKSGLKKRQIENDTTTEELIILKELLAYQKSSNQYLSKIDANVRFFFYVFVISALISIVFGIILLYK